MRRWSMELDRGKVLWVVAGLLLYAGAYWASSDTLTMTAFYPAPMGVYYQMTTTQQTTLARDGGNLYIGINPKGRISANDPKVMIQGNPGAGSSGVLNVLNSSQASLFYVQQNSAGIIGMGNASPQAALDVAGVGGAGAIHLGTQSGPGCSVKGLIAMVGSPTQPMWCDGSAWQPLQQSSTGNGGSCSLDPMPAGSIGSIADCYCVGPSPCQCNGGSGATCSFSGYNPQCPSGTTTVYKYFPSAACSGIYQYYCGDMRSPRWCTASFSCTPSSGWISWAATPYRCCLGYGYRGRCWYYGTCYSPPSVPSCNYGTGNSCSSSVWTSVECKIN